MKNEDALISVIIPVYNVERYLQSCLDSVFAQTYHNLEIILVDDGSTDGSGEICERAAEKDPRVRVIHQENRGLSGARNTGIEACTGAFLYFLDSDDAISPVTLAHLWTGYLRTKAEVVIGDYIRFSSDQIPAERTRPSCVSCSIQEAISRILLNQGIHHHAWGKLYRRNLWDGFRFPTGILYEDYAVIYDVLAQTEKAAVVTDALYYYRSRPGSIMSSGISEKNLSILDTSERVTGMLSERFSELTAPAVRLQCVTYMRVLADILEEGFGCFPKEQKRIIEVLRKNRKIFLSSPDVRKVDKLKLRALLAGRGPFYVMYRASDAKKASKDPGTS